MSRLLLPGIIAVTLAGCGSNAPDMATVSGAVTFEGQPVEEGEIRLVPQDKSHATQAGKIRNGAYSVPARIGDNRVEILASRVDPTRKSEMGPVMLDFIPAKYNSASSLTANVTPDGKNTFDFALSK